MHDEQLRRDLQDLTRRLERIERRLGLEAAAIEAPAIAPSAAPVAKIIVEPPAPIHPPTSVPPITHISPVTATPPPPLPPVEPVTLQRLQSRVAEVRDQINADQIEKPDVVVRTVAPPIVRQQARLSESSGASLEFLIGGKWMAWVGALVVVVAAGFLVQIGIKSGFWGRMAPELRCLLIAAFGGGLILGGEIALRRLGRAASVGLFGAGLGVMYLDAFATFRYFQIVSQEMAFVLMACVAVVGFALTLRTRFLTIGVLSMLGGYLTPILLHGAATHDLELLMFLTMLLGISLGLAAAIPRDFHVLRYVGLGGQVAIGFGWLVANSAQWKLGMVFMSAWWTMVLGESTLAAMRRLSPIGNPVMVVIATACYITGGCWILNQSPGAASDWLGIFTAMVAVIGAAAAMQFGPGVEVLRSAPRQPIDKLALTLWVQAGVLIAAAVALQFDGFSESIGWLAVGIAAIECGRRLPSRGVGAFGLVVLGLAITRVLLVDWWPRTMRTPLFEIGNVSVNRWSLLAMATLLVIHGAAQRIRTKASGFWPAALACIGAGIWLIVCRVQCSGLAITTGWLAGCAILLALERVGRRQRYFEIAVVILILCSGRWLVIDALLHRAMPEWNARASLPVLNWQMGVAAMIALVGWWVYRLARTREYLINAASSILRATWQWVLINGVIFGLIALSFEVDRVVERLALAQSPIWWSIGQVRQLLLTLLWGVGAGGVGLLAFAMQRKGTGDRAEFPRFLVGFAWLILGVCTIKWLVGDTLMWSVMNQRTQLTGALPLVNVQMLVGGVLVGAIILLNAGGVHVFKHQTPTSLDRYFEPSSLIPVAAAFTILWGLSFEIDRAISRIQALPTWMAAWDPVQLRALFITGLWAAGGIVMMHLGRLRKARTMVGAGWGVVALAACGWLTFDTLGFRFTEGVASTVVAFNVQAIIGAFVAVLMLHASAVMLRRSQAESDDSVLNFRAAAQFGFGLVAAIVLLLVSLEIDRFFADDPMARQTGFSVWWSIFGVMLVLLGFAKVSAAARYVGLGMLSLTLVKVLLVDFSALDDFPRVISTAAAGLLFIATSLVYTKLSPKILALREKSLQAEPPPAE